MIQLTREAQEHSRELLDWLRFDLGVEKPGQKLEAFAELTADDFVAEVRERRPNGASHLTPAAIAELMKTHQGYAVPERQRAAEIQSLEHRLSDLINQAYGLTDEDIALLWKTAPPRMPNARRTRRCFFRPMNATEFEQRTGEAGPYAGRHLGGGSRTGARRRPRSCHSPGQSAGEDEQD